ncbi:MAG: fumarylacetoacetate hydrolase family protein [Pseudoclavibacter sp.]|nr:fumarylacetoacetate hydrolase family protein [Pseudoclavibacter sp.]
MKIARFEHQGTLAFGILDEEEQELVRLFGDPLYAGFETVDERIPLERASLLAPVIPRSKVVAFGRNYAEHAAERGARTPAEPLMFLKPNTAVIGPGRPIVLPAQSERVDHEVELAVVIGHIARKVPARDAHKVVFGYTIANDVTARDLQERDGQWTRAKGFDSFCPLGPWIETEFDPSRGAIRCTVDGELRQSSDLSRQLHPVAALVEYASAVFTLLPGDVLLTGTPAGVGPLRAGQTVGCSIEGIGELTNPVEAR